MNKSFTHNSKALSSKHYESRQGFQFKDPNLKQDQAPKFKTQICRNLQSGYCEFGSKCMFAHSVEELQDRSIYHQKLVKCAAYFQNGYCISGNKCQFSHRDTSPETAANSPKHSRKASRKSSGDFTRLVFVDLESRRFYN